VLGKLYCFLKILVGEIFGQTRFWYPFILLKHGSWELWNSAHSISIKEESFYSYSFLKFLSFLFNAINRFFCRKIYIWEGLPSKQFLSKALKELLMSFFLKKYPGREFLNKINFYPIALCVFHYKKYIIRAVCLNAFLVYYLWICISPISKYRLYYLEFYL
jgi:hypothetical protein